MLHVLLFGALILGLALPLIGRVVLPPAWRRPVFRIYFRTLVWGSIACLAFVIGIGILIATGRL